MSSESVDIVQLRRYAAKENNGNIEKDMFIVGEQYVYNADRSVLYRDDIDEEGNIIKDIDRKSLYDSTGRLIEEQFYRDDFMYRKITYKGTAGIIELWMSEGIDFLTVKRMDLCLVPLLRYASKHGRTLEFVEVSGVSDSVHLFSEYQETGNGYDIEYVYSERGCLVRVSHINNGGRRKVVSTYDETKTKITQCTKMYLLESIKLRQMNGSYDEWTYALMEYFNGKDKRIEVIERETIQQRD